MRERILDVLTRIFGPEIYKIYCYYYYGRNYVLHILLGLLQMSIKSVWLHCMRQYHRKGENKVIVFKFWEPERCKLRNGQEHFLFFVKLFRFFSYEARNMNSLYTSGGGGRGGGEIPYKSEGGDRRTF